MSLGGIGKDGLQPDEAEFVAAEYLVKIIPKFTHGVFNCITGDFGRFDTGVPAEVPIWLALKLREDSLCQVLPPSWMATEYLSDMLREEKETTARFTEMPYYYTEIAWLLLSGWSREDIPNAEKVGELIQDIEAVRKQKLTKGVNMVLGVSADSEVPSTVELTNVGSSEVSSLRCSFFKALDGIVEAGHMQMELDKHRRNRSARTGGTSRSRDATRTAAFSASLEQSAADPSQFEASTTMDHSQFNTTAEPAASQGTPDDEADEGLTRRGESADGTVKLRRFR